MLKVVRGDFKKNSKDCKNETGQALVCFKAIPGFAGNAAAGSLHSQKQSFSATRFDHSSHLPKFVRGNTDQVDLQLSLMWGKGILYE